MGRRPAGRARNLDHENAGWELDSSVAPSAGQREIVSGDELADPHVAAPILFAMSRSLAARVSDWTLRLNRDEAGRTSLELSRQALF